MVTTSIGDALGRDWMVPPDTDLPWRHEERSPTRTRNAYGQETGSEAGPSDYARRAWIDGICRDRSGGDYGRRGCNGADDCLASSEDAIALQLGQVDGAVGHSYRRRGSRRGRRCGGRTFSQSPLPHLASLLPTFLLPFAFAPTASAAPPRHFPRQTLGLSARFANPPTPAASPSAIRPTAVAARAYTSSNSSGRRDVHYITSAAPPSILPAEVVSVDETVLPFIVTRGSDGLWTRVDDGWRLYGRQSGETPAFVPDPGASQTTSTLAIEEALPPGWGVQSTRTDFYRVPLIVVSSCIIAIGIVVAIIIIAFKRRKAHRRAKRRAERKRRKELAAAGLTEEDVNDSRNQASMREKLDDLQRQHRVKKKGDAAVVSSANARSRVRSWRAGLRMRKKGRTENGVSGEDGQGVISVIEEKPEEERLSDGSPGLRGSQDTDRSTPTVPSVEPGEGSRSGSDGFDSRVNTLSSGSDHQTASDRQSGSTDAAGHGENGSSHASGAAAASNPGAGLSAGTPYFPPAYRPASVRSLGRSAEQGTRPAASSSSPHASPPMPNGVEKTRAPGYYPAPATAEGEIALAVASRSDGKSRMRDLGTSLPVSDADEAGAAAPEPHRAHVATDDKRILERMRMAASAPSGPGQGSDMSSGDVVGQADGPMASAPQVEVDEHGFEALPADFDFYASDRQETGGTSRPAVQHHPSLPLPPIHRPHFARSYSVEREVHEQLDELNLLPSAPPVPRSHSPVALVASAPPLLEPALDGDTIPSAPPLPTEEGDDEAGGHPPELSSSAGHRDPESTSAVDQEQARDLASTPSAPPVDVDQDVAEQGESADVQDTPLRGTAAIVAPPSSSIDPASSPSDSLTRPDDSSRRPSEAPSENRLFLPRYEP